MKLAPKDWNITFKKHLRMHQITLFQDKKIQKFYPQTPPPVGKGTPPVGRGTPPPHTPPPRRLRRLDGRAFGARYSAPCLRLKDDLCIRLLLGPAVFELFDVE